MNLRIEKERVLAMCPWTVSLSLVYDALGMSKHTDYPVMSLVKHLSSITELELIFIGRNSL
jgi:hypothetical protein